MSTHPENEKTPNPAPVNEEDCPSRLERISGAVHRKIESAFEVIGKGITKRPGLVILGTVLLTIVLAQGVWLYDEERAGDKQFTPRGSRAVEDQEYSEDVFGYENRLVQVYFVVDEGKNVLERSTLEFMLDYYSWMTTEVATSYEGENINYTRICGRVGGGINECLSPRSVLSIWDYDRNDLTNEPDILAAVNSEEKWRKHVPSGNGVDYYLGYEEPVAPYKIGKARAARIIVELQNKKETRSGKDSTDPRAHAWELLLVDLTREKWDKRNGITVDVFTMAEQMDVQDDAIDGDIASLIIGYVLLVIYGTLVLSKGRAKYSHALLGVASIAAVAMATISAYGLCWYIGIKFNNVVQVLIVILLGIGIDDTFVIVDQWYENAHLPDMKDRLQKALAHAGPAITITSATDLVAFLAGSSTVLPALRDFCYYAAIGITFVFIYQCTFVAAILYIDSVRQSKNRADVLCCIEVEDDTGVCWIKKCGKDGKTRKWKEGDRGFIANIVGTWLPRMIVGTLAGRVVVALITVTFLSLGVWGVTEVTMNFNIEWFTPDDARIQDTYAIRDTFFGGRKLPVALYVKDVDYPALQSEFDLMKDLYEKNEWVVKGSTQSWFHSYRDWLVATQAHYNGKPAVQDGKIVTEAYYPMLRKFLDPKTGPPSASVYIDQLRWKEDGTLKASRVWIVTDGNTGEDGQAAIDCMDSLRETASKIKGMEVSPYTFVFVFFESFKVFMREAVQNLAVAGSCVFVIVMGMLASFYIGLIIVVTIACVDVCLIGFIYHIDVFINGVSVICVVVAIGLSVDYSVHIAHQYLTIRAKEQYGYSARQQRAAHALWSMGPAVANGGFSTFLAILPLSLAKSYIFKVFFRMFVLIIGFGLWFGLIVLPVVLSVVGPSPYHNARSLADHPGQNPLDPDFDKEEENVVDVEIPAIKDSAPVVDDKPAVSDP